LILADLVSAFLAALVVAVVPGYFWAACLCGGDFASRVAYGIGFSITLVPAVALLVPARFFGLGVTFYTAVFSVLIVLLTISKRIDDAGDGTTARYRPP